MESVYIIFIIIGSIFMLGLISWIFEQIGKFIELLHFKKKLNKLAPQIENIKTTELYAQILDLEKSYSSIVELLKKKYHLNEEQEVKNVDDYVRIEVGYRRANRKPRRNYRYRKYYAYR